MSAVLYVDSRARNHTNLSYRFVCMHHLLNSAVFSARWRGVDKCADCCEKCLQAYSPWRSTLRLDERKNRWAKKCIGEREKIMQQFSRLDTVLHVNVDYYWPEIRIFRFEHVFVLSTNSPLASSLYIRSHAWVIFVPRNNAKTTSICNQSLPWGISQILISFAKIQSVTILR